MRRDGIRTIQLFGGREDGKVFALPYNCDIDFRIPVMRAPPQIDLWSDHESDIFWPEIHTETYEWDGTFTEEEHRRYVRRP